MRKREKKEDILLQELTKMLQGDQITPAEREIFAYAKQQLEKKVYLPRIASDLKFGLNPLAIRQQLSANGKKIYREMLDPKFANRGFGAGLMFIFGGHN